MSIPTKKFQAGDIPSRRNIQDNIYLVLKTNPDKAFSSIELENMFDVRRQAINQALRSLDQKGLVVRKLIKVGSRNVTFVIIKDDLRSKLSVVKIKEDLHDRKDR